MKQQPTVFGDPASPHVRALIFALSEKDIVCKLEAPISPNALQRIFSMAGSDHRPVVEPRMVWGEHVIAGREDCLRFADEMSDRNPLMPTDPDDRARVEALLTVFYREAVLTLGSQVAVPYLAAIISGMEVEPLLPTQIDDALRTVDKLETLLGPHAYFGGNSLSLADIALGGLFEHLSTMREYNALVPKTSSLRSWYKRVSARPLFELTKQSGASIPGLYCAA